MKKRLGNDLFRFLVKSAGQAASGQKLPGFMAYLSEPEQLRSPLTEACELRDLISAYEHRAARYVVTGVMVYVSDPELLWSL